MNKDAKRRKKGIRAAWIILAVLVLVLAASFLMIRNWLGRTRYVGDQDVLMTEVLETESEAPPTAEEMYHPDEVVPVGEERTDGTWTLLVIGEGSRKPGQESIFSEEETSADGRPSERESDEREDSERKSHEKESSAGENADIMVEPAAENVSAEKETSAGGSPGQEEKAYGEAQAIILMTINHNTKEVYFTTFHPDLYVTIRNYGGHRLGSAYAAGGGALLEETIEKNYGIVIDQYASIRMHDVARIMEMEEFETLDISTEGVDVIENLVFQLSSIGPTKLAGYISELLPYVSHNIESSKMMGILLQVPKVVSYVSIKSVLPYPGMYWQLEGYLVPDIGPTSRHLQDVIYGEAVPETETESEKG